MKFSFALTAAFTGLAVVSALPLSEAFHEARSLALNSLVGASLFARDGSPLDGLQGYQKENSDQRHPPNAPKDGITIVVTGYRMDGAIAGKARQKVLEKKLRGLMKKDAGAFSGVTKCTITASKKTKKSLGGLLGKLTHSDFKAGYECDNGKKEECAFEC
ncbi:hypothetical protein C8J56DRAFT_1170704 [Mycena floridula]|nr:hypothetical protein C8J56DRAFT_1170704 [Mycena floridula]